MRKKCPSRKCRRLLKARWYLERDKRRHTRSYMTSSRSQRELVTEPGTVAKSFGLIVQCSIHHTLLSPWCAICFFAQVTQMCSLAKWAVQGSRDFFPLKVSPASGPAGGCLPCHSATAYPQRSSTGWGSERPPSVLILNVHSLLVWNICGFQE